jgi:hypothetical protein
MCGHTLPATIKLNPGIYESLLPGVFFAFVPAFKRPEFGFSFTLLNTDEIIRLRLTIKIALSVAMLPLCLISTQVCKKR